MLVHREKMKKWPKSVKKGPNWTKNGQNWEFSKFDNFLNILLTNKFDPGNERFKELLSYKIKT